AHGADAVPEEPLLNRVHQVAPDPEPAILGVDAQRDDVTGAIRLDHTDDKSDHLAARGYRLVANRLMVRQQVADGLAVIRLAVREAALIEPPAFVDVGLGHLEYNRLGRRCHQRLTTSDLRFYPSRPHRRIPAD